MGVKKMKVYKPNLLVLASTFPRYIDDTEPRFIFDLCLKLKKYYDVTVLVPSFPHAQSEEEWDGIKIVRFRYMPLQSMETLAYPGSIISRIRQRPLRSLLVPLFMLGMRYAIKRMLKRHHFDIIHSNWLIPQSVALATIKKTPPFVITGHGGDITSLNSFIFKQIKQHAIKRASGITLVSSALLHKARKLYSIDCPIKILPMGCDVTKFSPNKRDHSIFHSDNPHNVEIIFVGRLEEKKGVEYLIEAVRLLKDSIPDFHVTVVGEGTLKDELKRKVTRYALADKISFWGARPHPELSVILASADVYVLPSIIAKDGDSEGFPTSIVEAGASGLPIVTTVSGKYAFVEDNIQGRIVSKKDAGRLAEVLETLICNESLRKNMGTNAHRRAEEFSYERLAVQYDGFFKQFIPSKGDQQ